MGGMNEGGTAKEVGPGGEAAGNLTRRDGVEPNEDR